MCYNKSATYKSYQNPYDSHKKKLFEKQKFTEAIRMWIRPHLKKTTAFLYTVFSAMCYIPNIWCRNHYNSTYTPYYGLCPAFFVRNNRNHYNIFITIGYNSRMKRKKSNMKKIKLTLKSIVGPQHYNERKVN